MCFSFKEIGAGKDMGEFYTNLSLPMGFLLGHCRLCVSLTHGLRWKKLRYSCTVEHYSAIKRDKFEAFVRRWRHLETAVLGEISQTQELSEHVVSALEDAQNINKLESKIKQSKKEPGG